jgi:hypothetical protein
MKLIVVFLRALHKFREVRIWSILGARSKCAPDCCLHSTWRVSRDDKRMLPRAHDAHRLMNTGHVSRKGQMDVWTCDVSPFTVSHGPAGHYVGSSQNTAASRTRRGKAWRGTPTLANAPISSFTCHRNRTRSTPT